MKNLLLIITIAVLTDELAAAGDRICVDKGSAS